MNTRGLAAHSKNGHAGVVIQDEIDQLPVGSTEAEALKPQSILLSMREPTARGLRRARNDDPFHFRVPWTAAGADALADADFLGGLEDHGYCFVKVAGPSSVITKSSLRNPGSSLWSLPLMTFRASLKFPSKINSFPPKSESSWVSIRT